MVFKSWQYHNSIVCDLVIQFAQCVQQLLGPKMLALIAVCLSWFVTTEGYFLSDSRIQNPNLTSALSSSSSEVTSTCLQFDEKTTPTYNYNYDFLEVDSEGTMSSAATASFQASLSWGFISARVSGKAKTTSESSSKSTYIQTIM